MRSGAREEGTPFPGCAGMLQSGCVGMLQSGCVGMLQSGIYAADDVD